MPVEQPSKIEKTPEKKTEEKKLTPEEILEIQERNEPGSLQTELLRVAAEKEEKDKKTPEQIKRQIKNLEARLERRRRWRVELMSDACEKIFPDSAGLTINYLDREISQMEEELERARKALESIGSQKERE